MAKVTPEHECCAGVYLELDITGELQGLEQISAGCRGNHHATARRRCTAACCDSCDEGVGVVGGAVTVWCGVVLRVVPCGGMAVSRCRFLFVLLARSVVGCHGIVSLKTT